MPGLELIETQKSELEELPIETVVHIIGYLTWEDICNLGKTNAFFYKICKEIFWKQKLAFYYPDEAKKLKEQVEAGVELEAGIYFERFKICYEQPFFINGKKITKNENLKDWTACRQLYFRV